MCCPLLRSLKVRNDTKAEMIKQNTSYKASKFLSAKDATILSAVIKKSHCILLSTDTLLQGKA